MALHENEKKSNQSLKKLKQELEKKGIIEALSPPGGENTQENLENEDRNEYAKTSSNKKSQQETSKGVKRKKGSDTSSNSAKKDVPKSSTSKNKGGRPLKDKSKKATKKVTTYLTEADYLLLQETAESFDETIANYVRSIIKEHIRESK